MDVTIFSGLLPRPPRNCPSPGDVPPELLRHTGGGPFTSGNLVVVDAIERLPQGASAARVRLLDFGPAWPGAGLVAIRNGPTWVRGSWRDERRQDARCQTHRISSPVTGSAIGRNRITVRGRTTERRWSRVPAGVFELG